MKRYLCLLALLIAGCDSPSLGYMDVPAQRLEMGGMTFSIRQRGEEAEILRISVEALPSRSEVFTRAAAATEQATGCTVKAIDGDAALMRAALDC